MGSRILGVGTDIIEIDRVVSACKKDSFLKKNYSEEERSLISARANRAATNFAGKEAVAKAFGTGFFDFGLIDVEILRDQSGAPFVRLNGRAKELAKSLGITKIHISLSDTDSLAIAYVVAEGD